MYLESKSESLKNKQKKNIKIWILRRNSWSHGYCENREPNLCHGTGQTKRAAQGTTQACWISVSPPVFGHTANQGIQWVSSWKHRIPNQWWYSVGMCIFKSASYPTVLMNEFLLQTLKSFVAVKYPRFGDDWKKCLQLPPKDCRMRTSVSFTSKSTFLSLGSAYPTYLGFLSWTSLCSPDWLNFIVLWQTCLSPHTCTVPNLHVHL